MSEATAEQPTTADEPSTTDTQGNPDEAALGDAGKKALNAMKAERNQAKQAAAELQKQLDAINAANMSELEKAQKAAADAQAAALAAGTEALRLRVAAKHGISDEDADLFLTGSDAETIERQATALAARTSSGPKPDLSQGSRGQSAATDPATAFGQFLRNARGS